MAKFLFTAHDIFPSCWNLTLVNRTHSRPAISFDKHQLCIDWLFYFLPIAPTTRTESDQRIIRIINFLTRDKVYPKYKTIERYWFLSAFFLKDGKVFVRELKIIHDLVRRLYFQLISKIAPTCKFPGLQNWFTRWLSFMFHVGMKFTTLGSIALQKFTAKFYISGNVLQLVTATPHTFGTRLSGRSHIILKG